MAKNTQPIAKRCKALGISPAVMGYAKKNTTRNSNGNMRKKQSEYATQLKEKQKVKFIYGVLEKQFHNAYLKAEAMPGKTGENLLQLMERRLDNVVFRLGFAQTRRDARQLVSHAHFTVNGKKVNIPSYLIKAGDVIEVRESSRSSAKFAKLTGPEAPVVALPSWLDREAGTLKGVVNKLPERSDGVLPEGAMSPEEVSAASGKRATFILHVLTRQNATWQGTVDWLCGGEPDAFSSDLEFLKLVERHIAAL